MPAWNLCLELYLVYHYAPGKSYVSGIPIRKELYLVYHTKRARRVLNMLSRQGRRQRDAHVDAPAAEKRQEKCENKPLRKDILRDITKIMECRGDRLPAIRYRKPLSRGVESKLIKRSLRFRKRENKIATM
jgi:hypothetical protein